MSQTGLITIIKMNAINIKEKILKNVVVTFNSLHIIMALNGLCLLLTSPLRDDFLFQTGVVTSPVPDMSGACLKKFGKYIPMKYGKTASDSFCESLQV